METKCCKGCGKIIIFNIIISIAVFTICNVTYNHFLKKNNSFSYPVGKYQAQILDVYNAETIENNKTIEVEYEFTKNGDFYMNNEKVGYCYNDYILINTISDDYLFKCEYFIFNNNLYITASKNHDNITTIGNAFLEAKYVK